MGFQLDIQDIILKIAQCAPGFLLAIIIHEYAHGYVAKLFGDDTAEREGRLTFNPSAHIDPMGTILFPLIGVIAGWAVIGWARPVPVIPRNFTDMKKGMFWVSFAGPLSNFILGTLSAFILVLVLLFAPSDFSYLEQIAQMLKYSIFINFLLGAFNIIPFPPLDGSRMVAAYLKGETLRRYESLAQYAPMVILGVFALSIMGIPTIHYIIMPFIKLGNALPLFFYNMFS
ncbi:MAG: site-2 protease family protein [Bacteriovoracaceae bacterium]|jgi:Zn-dependent protease|nr:site-2 protease family protein [Halobacteriovoraceae bacterium]MDP7322285.1 site-2 protease family protein [Bacteriovoracaceae bacterium]